MLKINRFLILLLSLVIFVQVSISADEVTEVSMEILWWSIELFAPLALDFWSFITSRSEKKYDIDLRTYNSWTEYFSIEDLKWSNSWWWVYISLVDDFQHDAITWVTIAKSSLEVFMDLSESWITVLDSSEWSWSTAPQQIEIPDNWPNLTLDNQIVLLQRLSPTNWIIGKYWVQPKFTVTVPAMQRPWNYTATMMFTITEF